MAVLPIFLLPFEQVVSASVSAAGAEKRVKPAPVGAHANARANNQVASSADHSRFTRSPRTGLPLLADGDTALPSNATNFHGGWNASVDSRTGMPSFSMPVSSTLFDNGTLKRDLKLSWSGSGSPEGRDSFGLGSHWSWNVGTEHLSATEVAGHVTTDISLGDGHSFTMISDRDKNGQTVWKLFRHKLKDVLVTGKPGDWTVALADGLRFHLKNGYEDWEENMEGQRVWFYYERETGMATTRHLDYMCGHALSAAELLKKGNACAGDGVHITRNQHKVTVHGQFPVVLRLRTTNGRDGISSIDLPSLSSEGLARHDQRSHLYFTYDHRGNLPWLLRSVRYPDGMENTFLYNTEADQSGYRVNGIAAGVAGVTLPVVTEQVIHFNHGVMPDKKIWYRYGKRGNEHNYLGYQGEGSIVPGRDNLVDRNDDYTYSVTTDDGQVSTTTTYNKYHLPLTTERRDDMRNMTLSHARKDFGAWRHTTFASLPASYSMEKGSEKTYNALTEKGVDPGIAAIRVREEKKYDNSGQMIWKRSPSGRETFYQYCPAGGDRHCPKLDSGWPGLSMVEKTLVIPSHTVGQREDEEARETVYNYVSLPVSPDHQYAVMADNKGGHVANRHFWQVESKLDGVVPVKAVEGLKAGDALPEIGGGLQSKTEYAYNTDTKSPVYGQLKKLVLSAFHPGFPDRRAPLFNEAGSVVSVVPREKVSFNVITHIDKVNHTRTVSMEAVSAGDRARVYGLKQKGQSQAGPMGVQTGTRIYSLVDGLKLSTNDTLKEVNTTWKYDLWKRPVEKVMTPKTGGQSRTVKWRYLYTPGENAVVMTGPEGEETKVVLDGGNRVRSRWHRFGSQAGEPLEGDSGWIPDVMYQYSAYGQPVSKTVWHAGDPVDGKPGPAIALTTTYGYDGLNRRVWSKTPDGVVNVIARDDPALRQIRYRVATESTGKGADRLDPVLEVGDVNLDGKPVATYLIPLNPDALKHGKAVYSPALRMKLRLLRTSLMSVTALRTYNSYGLLPLSGHAGLLDFVRTAIKAKAWLTHTTTEYDGMGQRIKQTLGNGAVTRWVWRHGNVEAMIEPDGRIVHDTYNIQAQKVSRCVQPAGSVACHMLGTRGYDAYGNLAWSADESGHMIRYTHDSIGRLLSMRVPGTDDNPKDHVFTYKYNSIGRTEADLDGAPYARYHYDPVTWKLTDSEDHVAHIHYDYNKNGTLKKAIYSAPLSLSKVHGIDYPGFSFDFAWDRYKRPVSISDSFGNIYRRKHDRLGRVTEVRVRTGKSDRPVLLSAVVYDRFGRVRESRNDSGISRTIVYNGMGKPESTVDRRERDGSLIQRLNYTYDPDTGNITRLERDGPDAGSVETFRYDIQNNLTDMACVDTGHSPYGSLCPREMALKGSGLTAPPVIASQHYTFDDWNNIKTVTEALTGAKGQRLEKSVTYTYAHAKQDAATPEAFDPHRMTGFQERWSTQPYSSRPHTITYDSLGRIVVDAAGNRLEYNAFGQQSAFTNVRTGEITKYTYDGTGHQIAEQPFDSKGKALQSPLYMIYAGNHVMAQAQKDRRGQSHVAMELGGVAHSEDGVINRWYLHNYKGDVTSIFDGQGHLVSSMVYSPYGMAFNRAGSRQGGFPEKGTVVPSLWWQGKKPGFNGEMSDPATGYQFLGGGYRAYNPVYRHFMARDSYSPFTKIDGYGFGDNNPVMNTDPTGHIAKWVGYTFTAVSLVTMVGAGLIMPLMGLGLAATEGVLSTAQAAAFGVITTVGSIVPMMASGSISAITGFDTKYKKKFGSRAGAVAGIFNNAYIFLGSAISGTLAMVGPVGTMLSGTARLVLTGALIGGASSLVGMQSNVISASTNNGAKSKFWRTSIAALDFIAFLGMTVSMLFMAAPMVGKMISPFLKEVPGESLGAKMIDKDINSTESPAVEDTPPATGEREELSTRKAMDSGSEAPKGEQPAAYNDVEFRNPLTGPESKSSDALSGKAQGQGLPDEASPVTGNESSVLEHLPVPQAIGVNVGLISAIALVASFFGWLGNLAYQDLSQKPHHSTGGGWLDGGDNWDDL